MTYGEGTYGEATYGGVSVPVTTTSTHFPSDWNKRLRQVLGIAVVPQTGRFFNAWATAEGGNAKWNPLNTTLNMGTLWTENADYNTSHVRNYKYGIVGIVATALTLSERATDGTTLIYGGLLTDLKNYGSTKTAEQFVKENEADIKRWGTNPQTMLDILKTLP
jgi:hypothetical protein